jgi:hypothetical protein
MEVVETQEPAQAEKSTTAEQEKSASAESEKVFADENLGKDSEVAVPADNADQEPLRTDGLKTVVVTPEDKLAFLDSVVSNTRFTKTYKLFGGRVSITVRSLTQDELAALSAWAFKQAVADTTWHISGQGRKYAMAAQVAMFNGIELPPLESPLFATVDSDGKTVKPPAWVERSKFWDDKSAGIVDQIMKCINDFDSRYSILCNKANDENFWKPDTP